MEVSILSVKLNLGAGNTKIDGYVSVDKYDKEAEVQADIKELPFEDNSVDHIVCYQVIEHIPYNESEAVLAEMYRVLKPGKEAIIETPNIGYIAHKICNEGITDNTMYNLVGEYYRPWDKDRYDDWEMCAAAIHRNPWDFPRLERVAGSVGFEVNVNPQKKINIPENLSVRLTK